MTDQTQPVSSATSTVELTAAVAGAYFSHNAVSATDIPGVIGAISAALTGLTNAASPVAVVADEQAKATPAQIRKSVTNDALISFIDGKPYKTLKRHLTTNGMTVAEYKAKFGLPNDYPTTAPAYSEARSAMAKALGLGQGGRKAKAAAPAAKAPKATKARKPAKETVVESEAKNAAADLASTEA
jgi:predicted transcriptional regulator